jgi:hypothetical protein
MADPQNPLVAVGHVEHHCAKTVEGAGIEHRIQCRGHRRRQRWADQSAVKQRRPEADHVSRTADNRACSAGPARIDRLFLFGDERRHAARPAARRQRMKCFQPEGRDDPRRDRSKRSVEARGPRRIERGFGHDRRRRYDHGSVQGTTGIRLPLRTIHRCVIRGAGVYRQQRQQRSGDIVLGSVSHCYSSIADRRRAVTSNGPTENNR